MLKTARNNNARQRQRLKLMTAVGLVVPVSLVVLLQPQPTGAASKQEEKAATAAPALSRRALKPLDTFSDCRECPEMVMIPGGSFMMGSPTDEPRRNPNEGPQHRVTIESFAMGKTEVTFAEWDVCVTAGGCNGYKPPDGGWGRESRPVINVSWKDAKAYVSWLSQHTRKSYRLPSEAEWEYAARAGTTTLYSFGDTITIEHANCSKSALGPTKVGAYPPNPWGLYDMHGNVEEWVEDSWDGQLLGEVLLKKIQLATGYFSYEGAPTDGTSVMPAVKDPNPHVCALRGGSWRSNPMLSANTPYIIVTCRSAARHMLPESARTDDIGFRVARTLY